MYVDLQTLSKAISAAYVGIGRTEAIEKAEFVLNFFGFEKRVLDNLLTLEERDVFYQLESHRILKTSREDTTLTKGKEYRLHFWEFDTVGLETYLNPAEEKETPMEADSDTYDESVWEEVNRARGDVNA